MDYYDFSAEIKNQIEFTPIPIGQPLQEDKDLQLSLDESTSVARNADSQVGFLKKKIISPNINNSIKNKNF